MRLSAGVDLSKARDDLAAFAALAGHPLMPWQAHALKLEARTTVLVSARQLGKSHSLAVLAAWWAYRQPEQRVLIVSAGEDAARRLLATVRRLVTGSPLLSGSVVDEGAGLVTLSNGGEIRSVPASERQVRGWSVDLLLVDEAALVSDDLLLGAALPTTAARPNARIVLASTPWAPDGAFYRNAMAGMDGGSEYVRSFHWRVEDAPWITPAVIEHARATLPDARFRAEYEGEWTGASDAMFSPDLLQRASADFVPYALSELAGPARLAIGVDWGVKHDRSACAVIARLPLSRWNRDLEEAVYGVVSVRAWEAGAPLAGVVDEIVDSPARWGIYSYETNGVGAGPGQDLERRMRKRHERLRADGDSHGFTRATRNAVATTATVKAEALSKLKLMLERGTLLLPRDEALMRELAGLRVELRQSGSVGIESGELAGHDDLADALWIALGPWSRNGRAGFAVPDAQARGISERDPLPGYWGGEDTVETGAGLIVPRRPWLQGVFDTDVTQPPRATEPDPEPTPIDRAREHVAHVLSQRNGG